MFNGMYQHLIHSHVGIGAFHAIAIFFDQSIVSFNRSSPGFEFIDMTLIKIIEQPQFR